MTSVSAESISLCSRRPSGRSASNIDTSSTSKRAHGSSNDEAKEVSPSRAIEQYIEANSRDTNLRNATVESKDGLFGMVVFV